MHERAQGRGLPAKLDMRKIRLNDNQGRPSSRFRRRSRLITAACVLLITLVAAPLPPEALPGPLKGLAAPSPVQAQDDPDDDDDEPDYTTGTPGSCPTTPVGWITKTETCELNIPVPCPTGYPNLSLSFPSYCYTEAAGTGSKPPECSNPGVSNAVVISVDSETCRIHVLRTCSTGIFFRQRWTEGINWDADNDGEVDSQYDANDDDQVDDEHNLWRCKAIQRRTWTCPDGYLASNEFNSCYRPASQALAGRTSHPACDTVSGAPTFAVLECGSYAGDDYDDSRLCSSVSGDFTAVTGGAAALYWCSFDSAKLSVDCNRATTPSGVDCAAKTAYCLMRASRTGGCDVIKRNLTCAGLQAAYIDASDKVIAGQNATSNGCTPCLVLPFSSVSSDCPVEIAGQPSYATAYLKDFISQTRALGRDLLRGSARCQHPPPGRLEVRSVHQSKLPVVNTDMIFDFEDIIAFSYAEPDEVNPIIRLARTQGGTQTSWKYAGECIVDWPPAFFIKVEELWPGESADHRTRITRLFGADALDWWNNLTTEEQTRLTTARGTLYSAEHDCHHTMPIWCKWRPKKAGYYSITGVTIVPAESKSFALRDTATGNQVNIYSESNDLWEATFPITREQAETAKDVCDIRLEDGRNIKLPSSFINANHEVVSRYYAGIFEIHVVQFTDYQGNQAEVHYFAGHNQITKIIDSNGNTFKADYNRSTSDEYRVALLIGSFSSELANSPVTCGAADWRDGLYVTTEPVGVQVNEISVLTRSPTN